MAATQPRLAGWIETRFSNRRGRYQSRLRYRPGPQTKPVTVEEVWHDPPDGRVGRTRDLRAAENGRALLGDLQLDLTQRLRRSSGPAFQRGALTTLGQFWDEEWETRELARRPANTRANYGYSFGNWVRPYLGGLSLEEIVQRGTEIGHQWIDAMQRDEAGVATITYAISVEHPLQLEDRYRRVRHQRTGPFILIRVLRGSTWNRSAFARRVELAHLV